MDKQLVFAFIKHYRCLSEVGINFDPRHYVEYDSKTKKLSFKENILPYDFFPDTIAGITAIVGKNGVGKSTIIQWVFERIVSGCAVDELNGIIIIRDSGKSILSAGELAMLNLFSRLRSVWNERLTVSNAMTHSMIILDEVENSFHPEWQRRLSHGLKRMILLFCRINFSFILSCLSLRFNWR
ncbi:MAG: hypothetical protein K2O49_06760 [Muribaculaceae bacterium]|nr:hypothetical protein [Muribaculaceae bacterium]